MNAERPGTLREVVAGLATGLLAFLTARSFDASVALTLVPTLGGAGLGAVVAGLAGRRPRERRAGAGGGDEPTAARLLAAHDELRRGVVRASAVLPAAAVSSWSHVLGSLRELASVWDAPGTGHRVRLDAVALAETWAPRVLAAQAAVRAEPGDGEGARETDAQLALVRRAGDELVARARQGRQRSVEADGAALEARFAHLTAMDELRRLDPPRPDR